MSDFETMIRYTGVERRVQRREPGAMGQGRFNRRRSDTAGRRHSAITSKIPNWNSYRTWAYKTRGSWEKDS